jgi:peptidoglycan/LPS O-acetylase OafA/YrhL
MQTTESLDARGRMAALDALRGVAILLVVIGHYLPGRVIGGVAADILHPFGAGGVVLFFVLSGFLIERNLTGQPDVIAYGMRRFFRIMPAYWVAMLVLVGVSVLAREPAGLTAPRVLFANATLLQDVLRAPLISGVFWTLLLETKFYLLAPFLKRGGINWIIAAPLIVIVANAAVFLWRGEASHLLTYLVFCLVGMTMGPWSRGELPAVPTALIALAAAVATGIFSPYYKTGLVVFGTLSPLALAYAVRKPIAVPGLAVAGAVSYSWYLYHAGIGYPLMTALEARPYGLSALVTTLIAVAVTFLIAAVSYRFVEQPAIAAGRRLEKRWLGSARYAARGGG